MCTLASRWVRASAWRDKVAGHGRLALLTWILGSGALPSKMNWPPRSSVRHAACAIRCVPAQQVRCAVGGSLAGTGGRLANHTAARGAAAAIHPCQYPHAAGAARTLLLGEARHHRHKWLVSPRRQPCAPPQLLPRSSLALLRGVGCVAHGQELRRRGGEGRVCVRAAHFRLAFPSPRAVLHPPRPAPLPAPPLPRLTMSVSGSQMPTSIPLRMPISFPALDAIAGVPPICSRRRAWQGRADRVRADCGCERGAAAAGARKQRQCLHPAPRRAERLCAPRSSQHAHLFHRPRTPSCVFYGLATIPALLTSHAYEGDTVVNLWL